MDLGHLSLSVLINIKQTRPGMSMTEKITLVIDVPGRVCYFQKIVGLKLENCFYSVLIQARDYFVETIRLKEYT